ncbi:DUF4349 domain-containing protein [Agromyces protaetiae]|uniref:DUF4349 domain-containing protein n=1 Tax=Agromyces protaetiae TaxID=2509455 RepID=A0A4P6FED1_9MICO|nr:DUF4349 domain-containing protein [Agromyces protaetiae]QAY73363.1 DUF4349 domain-containing protein [Agromyces protaetiae]
MSSRTPRSIAAAGLLAAVLLLAGCSASGGSTASYDVPAQPAPGQGESFAEDGSTPGGAADSAGGSGNASSSVRERSVVTTGWVRLTVENPVDASAETVRIVDRVGGRVDHREETPGTDFQSARASLTLRIPSDDLDGVIEQLRELGRVDSIQQDATDVTAQRTDLDARVEALAKSVNRLEALLAGATSTEDLITIESEITTRQAELDSLTQQRDLLVDQVDFSTLSVEFVTEEAAPEPKPADFWSGLTSGWNALMTFFAGLAVVLGVLLPWIGLLAVVGAIVLAIVLGVRSAGRRRATESDASGSDVPRA